MTRAKYLSGISPYTILRGYVPIEERERVRVVRAELDSNLDEQTGGHFFCLMLNFQSKTLMGHSCDFSNPVRKWERNGGDKLMRQVQPHQTTFS